MIANKNSKFTIPSPTAYLHGTALQCIRSAVASTIGGTKLGPSLGKHGKVCTGAAPHAGLGVEASDSALCPGLEEGSAPRQQLASPCQVQLCKQLDPFCDAALAATCAPPASQRARLPKPAALARGAFAFAKQT